MCVRWYLRFRLSYRDLASIAPGIYSVVVFGPSVEEPINGARNSAEQGYVARERDYRYSIVLPRSARKGGNDGIRSWHGGGTGCPQEDSGGCGAADWSCIYAGGCIWRSADHRGAYGAAEARC